MAPTDSKPFDVVVFGATGFTGALVARYLLQEPESSTGAAPIRWALAARSERKLEAVKQELKTKVPSVSAAAVDAVPTLVADSGDEASLVAMVRQTKVVRIAILYMVSLELPVFEVTKLG